MGAAMAPQSSTRAAVVADDEAKRHCECAEEMCSSPAGTAGLALASVPPCREGRSSGSTLVRRSRVWTRWALGNGRAIGALSMIAVGLFQRAPNARSARSSDRKIEDSAYIVPDAVKFEGRRALRETFGSAQWRPRFQYVSVKLRRFPESGKHLSGQVC